MAESSVLTPGKRRGKGSKVAAFPAPTPPETPPIDAVDDETPAGSDEPAERTARVSRQAFPTPPKGTGKGNFCEPEAGMSYWRAIPASLNDRTAVYVNREWPVLDRVQELEADVQALVRQGKKRPPFKYIDKPAAPFPADTRHEFLTRYGSGIYKVYINDTGVKKKGKDQPGIDPRTLCKFIVHAIDSDFPTILDPSRADQGLGILDWTHPENKSFISQLKMRGVQPPPGVEVGDMSTNNEVIGRLADKVESLSEKVAGAHTETMFAKIREELGTKQTDPLMLRLFDLVMTRTAAPAAAPAPAADSGTSVVIGMLQRQLDRVEAQLEKAREAEIARASQPPPDPFAYFERMVTTFEKGKALFGGNTNGAPGQVKQSRMSGSMEFWREVIPDVINSPILTALAKRISDGPVLSLGNPAATGAAGTGAAGQMSDAELLTFVQYVITPAMLSYLQEGATGSDFASWVHAGFPNKLAQLQRLGVNNIIQTYRESPTWNVIKPKEAEFTPFVVEFVAWRPEQGSGSDGAEAGPIVNGNAAAAPIDLDAELGGGPLEGSSF